MRQTLTSALLAAALLLRCYALSAALPTSRVEDGSPEQDALSSLLSDEPAVVENGFGEARGGPRVIVVADPGLWRELRALHGGTSVLRRRADDGNLVAEHREAGQDLGIPILRRDNMRCMVGRVYRPCWEV